MDEGYDISRNHAWNRLPNFGADRRREDERGDMGPCEGHRVRDQKRQRAEREALLNPFQGGPNVIQAFHGVHGTGKKKTVNLSKLTPADVKARLQQEIDVQHVAEHR
jgi:hypothetical protein